MWLIALAAVALVAGNWLRKSGVEAARANPHGSPAALAGRRTSGIGTWINMAGSLCLLAGIFWQWL
jgi:hypothetical protein